MRAFIVFGLLVACALAGSTYAAAIEGIEGDKVDVDKAADAAAALLEVEAGAAHGNEAEAREARQFGFGGGYYGRPYGGYGGYGGGYGRPYYGGGYGGYGGGYGRPYYGGGYGGYGGHYPGFGFYG